MDDQEGQARWRPDRRQVAISVGFLFLGLVGLMVMGAIRRAPDQVERKERVLPVDAIAMEPQDCPVVLSGFGAVRPLRLVAIAAEVPGILTEVHPSLRMGQVIPAGEVLFAVDDRDYLAAVEEASALADQGEGTIQRLEEELRRNQDRLETVKRNLALAQSEFDRVRELFETHQVGSQSEMEMSELPLNTAQDAVDQVEKGLAIGPLMIAEAKAANRAAQSRLNRARRQLERCTVRAPFDARVVRARMEKGQMVHAAAEMVVLADDSVLEISVPLDARQAYQWLKFKPGTSEEGKAWFSEVESVPCVVRWTEAPETHRWEGNLQRVEQVSVETRTLKVVIRVQGADAGNEEGFPLVEGMFCSVEIPGQVLHNVYRVPRWSVSVDETVYLAVDDRLVTRPVSIVYTHQDDVLIDEGLEQGDVLISTRLGNPQENTLLDVNLIPPKGRDP